MAKTKKKSPPPKSKPTAKAPTKSVKKPAPKAAAAHKKAAAPAKPVAKAAAPQKKGAAKPVPAPAKKAAAPVAATKGKEKEKLAAATAKKPVAAPAKAEKKAAEKVEAKKAAAPAVEPTSAKKDLKKEAKAAPKKGRTAKKEEAENEDDFVVEDDGFGSDEITEYEEELKAVEELDEENVDDEAWSAESKDKSDDEVILTDAEGRRYCRSRDCDQIGIVDGYCRYHYLLFWKKIQVRKKILADGKLERYVEELTSRYPDKFLEMIRRDLRTEKDFVAAIQELEIDESSNDAEFEEDTSAFIEEVRGMGEGGSASGVEEEEF